MKNDIQDQVSSYYGKTLQSTFDLKMNACSTTIDNPNYLKLFLSELYNKTLSKYYNYWLIIPAELNALNDLNFVFNSRVIFQLIVRFLKSEVIGLRFQQIN